MIIYYKVITAYTCAISLHVLWKVADVKHPERDVRESLLLGSLLGNLDGVLHHVRTEELDLGVISRQQPT
jgi:hypothetical protein